MAFYGWLWWACHALDVALRCVGAVFLVQKWLAPWTWWMVRRALCWTRWALCSHGDAFPGGTAAHRLQPSTCGCCGGVDFDGMAGRWAVVTGCTDGIGKEYALQLADRGINVALVSRNRTKLQTVADDIRTRHRDWVRTRIIVADFTSRRGTASLMDTYDGVRRGLDGLDVALLVNNAGTCYARPDRLLDLPECCSSGPTPSDDPLRDIIECNVLATLAMSRIAMPLMIADHRRGRAVAEKLDPRWADHGPEEDDGEWLPFTKGGVVVNISSATAVVPCPLLSAYGASKAFVHKFSVELAAEYAADERIDVRCLNTGFVATKLSRMRPATAGLAWIPGPDLYVRHSLRALACHCACRIRRNGARVRESGGGGGDSAAWLTGLASAVFDSPSSPFTVGHTDITTTGFVIHTVMVYMINVATLLFGEKFISKIIGAVLALGRDRIAKRDEEKTRETASAEECQ